MNCPKCNSVNEMGSLFCSNCGMRFDNNGNESVSVPEPVITNVSQENVELLNTDNLNNTNSVNSNLGSNEMGTLNSNINYNNQGNVSNNTSSNMSFNTNTNPDVNQNNNMNMSHSTNQNNMNTGTNNNLNSVSKINRSGNIITVVLVLVIAIVAVVVCYLMVSGNKSEATDKNSDTVASANTSEVTVNGRTGKVPKGWSFVSGIEAGTDYESVFLKDTQDSLAAISAASNVTFNDVKNSMYALKTKYEANGFSDLSVTTKKKNGVEYILFNGILEGSNYHVLYMNDGVGISGSEGPYASSDDLETIVNFVTGLKKSVAVKGNVSESKVKLFDIVLEK